MSWDALSEGEARWLVLNPILKIQLCKIIILYAFCKKYLLNHFYTLYLYALCNTSYAVILVLKCMLSKYTESGRKLRRVKPWKKEQTTCNNLKL